MAEEFDFSLFGDVVVRPSTGETADPIEVLADKVVRIIDIPVDSYWWHASHHIEC